MMVYALSGDIKKKNNQQTGQSGFTKICIREAAKKVIFLVARPLRGGGGNGLATTKITFFEAIKA